MIKGFDIEDLTCVTGYLSRQIVKAGVIVRTGAEVNAAVVKELQPDVVILAAGGVTAVPDIPGIENHRVMRSSALHHQFRTFLRFFSPRMLRRLTKIWIPLGRECLIIGGGIHGCQLAEFLVTRRRRVTIVEATDTIGEGLIPADSRRRLLTWLQEQGVTMLAGVKCEEITDRGLSIITKEGEKKVLKADSIIPALPLQPNHELLEALKKQVSEIYEVGDCREPHLSAEAIADGARIGYKI
jgi:2,4-dienoyl-CoA reductase (NADPH2)